MASWQQLTTHYRKFLLADDWTITVVVDPFLATEGGGAQAEATSDGISRITKIQYELACTPDPVTVLHELLHVVTHELRCLFYSVCGSLLEGGKITDFTKEVWDRDEETVIQATARRLAATLPRCPEETDAQD